MRLSAVACFGALLLGFAACMDTSGAQKNSLLPSAFTMTPGTYTDFYGWDGHFIRRVDLGPLRPSADSRYYVPPSNLIFTRDGKVSGVAPNWGSYLWAQDGDVVCADDYASESTLYFVDARGKTRAIPLGHRIQGIYACSVTTNRVVVLDGPGQTFSVLSLDDGHVESTVPLIARARGYIFSPDANWLAVPITLPDGATIDTDVVNLRDGTIHSRLSDQFAEAFTPDSKYLLVNDEKEMTIKAMDWRTGFVAWTKPGYLWSARDSDAATNILLMQIAPDSGGLTVQLWIVTAGGAGVPFFPRTDA